MTKKIISDNDTFLCPAAFHKNKAGPPAFIITFKFAAHNIWDVTEQSNKNT